MKSNQSDQDALYAERTSLVICPKCRSECREIWLALTSRGKPRKRPKLECVVCKNMNCMYDLSTAQQPEQRLVVQRLT